MMDEINAKLSEVAQASNSNNSKKPSILLSAYIKLSSVLVFLTAYSHFFGYSFLKGKLEALGFHAAFVDPTINETLYLAAEGVVHGAYKILVDYLFTKELFWVSVATAIIFVLVAYCLLFDVNLNLKLNFKNSLKNKSPEVKGRLWNIFILSVVALFGLLWQAFVAFVIFVVLAVLWSGMSLGQRLGKHSIELLLKDGVCEQTDWKKREKRFLSELHCY